MCTKIYTIFVRNNHDFSSKSDTIQYYFDHILTVFWNMCREVVGIMSFDGSQFGMFWAANNRGK